jgi:hypothetical protein
MRTPSLEDVPFRLLLVATWAMAWGGVAVYNAVLRLNETEVGFVGLLLAANAAVVGTALLTLAVLLFTSKPFVRKVAVGTFVVLAVTEAFHASAFDVVAIATVSLHLTAAVVLVFTREFFRSDRVTVPEDGATRFGI